MIYQFAYDVGQKPSYTDTQETNTMLYRHAENKNKLYRHAENK